MTWLKFAVLTVLVLGVFFGVDIGLAGAEDACNLSLRP